MVVICGSIASHAFGRDLGVLVLPIHQGKWTSSLLYEYLKVSEDFDNRGRVDFKSHAVGSQFGYGITDQIAVAVKVAVLVDPQEDAQGSQWQSRSGYLYGVDLYNEVFPATGYRPGIQLSVGATGFQVPLDRLISGNTVTTIDQRVSGVEYHGAVLATLRLKRLTPYAGLRSFGSSATWRDNRPEAGATDGISGHAHGNLSIVAGLPVQVTPDVRIQMEGRFLYETAATVGFTIASF
jgi:hypothetical protein